MPHIPTAAEIRGTIKYTSAQHAIAEAQKALAGWQIELNALQSDNGAILASDKRAAMKALQESRDLGTLIEDLKPEYKHDMGAGEYKNAVPGSYVGDGSAYAGELANKDRPAMLAPGQKALDYLSTRGTDVYDEDFRYGYLGSQVQALMGEPDNLARYKRHLPQATKDALSSANDVLIPTPVSAMLIDLLRARTVVSGLGAVTVPMASATLKVPRVVQDPTASWLNEGATITASDADTDGVTLTARRLTALSKFGQELAEDSDPVQFGRIVAESMARSFAVKLDAAALRGSGVAPEPAGIRNASGVQILDLGANGADASWDTLADLGGLLTAANTAATGFVWAPRTEKNIGKLKATGSGEYLSPPSFIADIPRRATSSVPINLTKGTTVGTVSEIYAGDWAQLMLGMRLNFTLQTLLERYADEGKVGVIGRLRADVALQHGAAFAVAVGVNN